jgi:hypothetical protein
MSSPHLCSHLPPEAAEAQLKKYGAVLMEKVPQETAQFLKSLCSQQQVGGQTLHPEDFISLFINNPEAMIEFLEHIVVHRSVIYLGTVTMVLFLEHTCRRPHVSPVLRHGLMIEFLYQLQ